MRLRIVLAFILCCTFLVGAGSAALPGKSPSSFNSKLNALVQPYSFSFGIWEINTIYNEIKQGTGNSETDTTHYYELVAKYFSSITKTNELDSDLQAVQAKNVQTEVDKYKAEKNQLEQQIAGLKTSVERIIARQINQTLAEQGIYNPFGDAWFKLPFPPVKFKLEKPLNMLIVSPRYKIQRIDSSTLNPDMTTAQMEALESSVDSLNVASLVVQIGGLAAAYPTFVADNADLQFTIDTAAHEWVHQYLAFKPLGFLYILDLLGITSNPRIDTMNETVASMVGQELGKLIYDKYYARYQKDQTGNNIELNNPKVSEFDKAMREIRQTVDAYLSSGQIEQAEKYMNQEKQYLASKGYYIRKLNQAYFAFYGSYADSPTSIDPIGQELRSLRTESPSIKSFLNSAANLTSIQDLTNAIR
jgi:hypothetical protein